MFRTNFIFSKIAKTCENQFKNKVNNVGCSFNKKSSRRLFSHQIFTHNSSEVNGYPKFLTINQSLKFNGNKNKFSKISDEKCWKCKQYLELKKFSCGLCGALQKPKEKVNYFELFGISQKFDVDLDDLSNKYKNLQKVFHPDKFITKSKEEIEISEMYSRLVNKAYTVLKDPLSRGFYILELNKISVDATFPVEQDFLMKIMEKNEELETICTESKLNKFWKANNDLIDEQIGKINEAFRFLKLDEAKVNLFKLNYFINLDSKIKGKLSDIDSKNS